MFDTRPCYHDKKKNVNNVCDRGIILMLSWRCVCAFNGDVHEYVCFHGVVAVPLMAMYTSTKER